MALASLSFIELFKHLASYKTTKLEFHKHVNSFPVSPFHCNEDELNYSVPMILNMPKAINYDYIPNIYPLLGVNRPNYCGQPGFEIKCQDNVPMINMRNINFRILEMNYSTARAVKVAWNDYWGTIAPLLMFNSNINFSLFNYGSGLQNMSFYYRCNTTNPRMLNAFVATVASLFRISHNHKQLLSYDPVVTMASQSEVLIPVLETAALAIESKTTTIQEAIDGGFVLGLKIDNRPCNSCEASGGKCGMNSSNSDVLLPRSAPCSNHM